VGGFLHRNFLALPMSNLRLCKDCGATYLYEHGHHCLTPGFASSMTETRATPRTDAMKFRIEVRSDQGLPTGDYYEVLSVEDARTLERALQAAEGSLRLSCHIEDLKKMELRAEAAEREREEARFRPMNEGLRKWLDENAPDCGDNSCLFGGAGKGGMRTNGGCRCFKDLPTMKRIYVERLQASLRSPQSAPATGEERDAARYRWLRSKFSAVGSPAIYWNCEQFEPSENPLEGDTLDAAIDAALGKVQE
jgi:hypothetical protein